MYNNNNVIQKYHTFTYRYYKQIKLINSDRYSYEQMWIFCGINKCKCLLHSVDTAIQGLFLD